MRKSDLDKVKLRVLSRIKPRRREKERLENFVRNVLELANSMKNEFGFLEALPVGSIARDTWLRGESDVDIFFLFPKSISRDELEERGIKLGKLIVKKLKGKYELKYAEHPYVRAKINDFDLDLVPCYKIEIGERIISAVDRSPLHTKFVLSNLKAEQRDEARLLKQFCKGIGVYGSDLKTRGVSGYLCELLIIEFGSFESVLQALSNLKPGSVIDIANWWNGSLPKELKAKFRGQPLIVIDPVDKFRNVAASLSCENFAKLVCKSREFLEKPSLTFFFPRKRRLTKDQIKKLRERGTHFVALIFKKPDVIDDVLYPQLRKTLRRLTTSMHMHGFRVIRAFEFVESNKAMLIFELEYDKLPNVEKRVGPSIFVSPNREDFLRKYSSPPFGPYIEGENLVIEKKRELKTVEELLKNRYISLSPSELRAKGVASEIAKVLPKAKIASGNDFFKLIRKMSELSVLLREKYFETKLMLVYSEER